VISPIMTTNQIAQLSDDALLVETSRAAAGERQATAALLELLMEVDRRRLYLGRGYSSMFVYCTSVLRFSEQAAYSRITAARAARRFPRLLGALASGDLTLSSVGLLAPHLTDDNSDQLIDAACGKSTREVERMIAGLVAQPDIPASLRALPTPRQSSPLLVEATVSVGSNQQTSVAVATVAAASSRPVVAPLGPRRYLLKLTISEETHHSLQRLRGLMRHAIPDGDPSEIIGRALTLLLEHVEQQKSALTDRPRPRRSREARGRRIPAVVRRAVWTRDEGRCAFKGTDGRCAETGFLEFHHVTPFAVGGPATTGNIQLRCRAHNAYEASPFFGTMPRANSAGVPEA
jgi:hypothetical protein